MHALHAARLGHVGGDAGDRRCTHGVADHGGVGLRCNGVCRCSKVCLCCMTISNTIALPPKGIARGCPLEWNPSHFNRDPHHRARCAGKRRPLVKPHERGCRGSNRRTECIHNRRGCGVTQIYQAPHGWCWCCAGLGNCRRTVVCAATGPCPRLPLDDALGRGNGGILRM